MADLADLRDRLGVALSRLLEQRRAGPDRHQALGEVLPFQLALDLVIGLVNVGAYGVGKVLTGRGKFKGAHGV